MNKVTKLPFKTPGYRVNLIKSNGNIELKRIGKQQNDSCGDPIDMPGLSFSTPGYIPHINKDGIVELLKFTSYTDNQIINLVSAEMIKTL